METKQTHFKMYKDGRKWVFACAVVLAMGGSATVAHADDATPTSRATHSTQVTSAKSPQKKRVVLNHATKEAASASESSVAASSQASSATSTSSATSSASSTTSQSATSQSSAVSSSSSTSESTPVSAAAASTKTVTPASGKAANQSLRHSKLNTLTKQRTAKAKTTSKASTTLAPLSDSAVQSGGSVYDDFPNETNLLGVSSNFHIFAREAELNAHTNGNLAVGKLSGNVNFGTNIIEELLDKDISYIQSFDKMANSSFVSSGDSRTNKVIFGEGLEIDLSNPNRPKVNGVDMDHLKASEVYQDQNGMTYIDFDKEFAKLKQTNSSLANEKSVKDYTSADFPDQNNRVIDVSDMTPDENGHIVINLSPEVMNSGTPITIAGLSPDADGNTVIINVDTGGQQDYTINSQVKVQYSDGSDRNNQETEDFGDNHLLWNFVDNSAADKQFGGKLTIDRAFQGSILAPSATVVANQNVDGNIIADKVIVNAETHRWDLQDPDKKGNEEEEEEEEEENDLQIAVPLPGIDIELPSIEKPGTEEPGTEKPGTEEPGEGTEGPEKPGIIKPGIPGISVPGLPGTEKPGTEEPGTEKPGTEEPGTEKPGTEEPGTETPGTEEPGTGEETEQPDTETPGENVDEKTPEEIYEHEHGEEIVEEFEHNFESVQTPAAEQTLLAQLNAAITQAAARHDSLLVTKLQAIRQQLLQKMGLATDYGTGESLPQTDEVHSGWAQALGLALAGTLLGSWLIRRKRRN